MDSILENGGIGDGSHRLRKYFLRYSLAFAVLAFLCFSVYIFTGKTLIWEVDAWSQHYKALIYYAQYLRGIVRTLFSEGRLVVPRWDFAFGEGGDILTTLHYYVIGDPLTVFSVFVPSRYMHIFYDALMLVRMYAAGALFSCFCFVSGHAGQKRPVNYTAVGIGSFTYAFSYWAIVNAGRHPYFLNPMIYFPLILIGFEYIMRGRRPYLFIAAVGISALSNFYFFYMLVLVTVVYVAVRLVTAVGQGLGRRDAVRVLVRTAVGSVIGLLMSAVVLLPVCAAFLGDSRAGVDYAVGLFYPPAYYAKLPGLLMGEGGGDNWICMGFSVLTVPAFVLALRDRGGEHRALRVLLILSFAGLCLPVVGHVMNGFTYVTNRWSWAFAAAAGYAVTVYFDRMTSMSRREYAAVLTTEAILAALCILLDESRTVGALSGTASAAVTMALLAPFPRGREALRRGGAAVMSLLSIAVNALSFTAPWGYDYASEHIDRKNIYAKLLDNEATRVKEIAETAGEDGFFRYSGPSVAKNAGALAGLSSGQYFWSLSNPGITERNTELALSDYWIFRYSGYDGRTAFNMLSDVRYYVVPKGDRAPVPYGYEPVESTPEDRYLIYENKNVPGFVYGYGAVISEDAWEQLSPSEKEEAMMYGVLVDGGSAGSADGLPVLGVGDVRALLSGREPECEVVCAEGSGVFYEDGRFTVTEPNATAVIRLGENAGSELYLSLMGLQFKSTKEFDLYFGKDDVDPGDSYGKDEWDMLGLGDKWRILREVVFANEPTGATLEIGGGFTLNSVTCYNNRFQFYNGRDDFVVNLGYHARGIEQIEIKFKRRGIYSFDSMKVEARDAAQIGEAAVELGSRVPADVTVGTDTVTAEVKAAEDTMLVLAVPYSEGWRAYVDGEPAETVRANVSYIGVRIGAGEHEVTLRYDTPLLGAGAVISVAGVILFGAYAAVTEARAAKEKKKKEKEGKTEA